MVTHGSSQKDVESGLRSSTAACCVWPLLVLISALAIALGSVRVYASENCEPPCPPPSCDKTDGTKPGTDDKGEEEQKDAGKDDDGGKPKACGTKNCNAPRLTVGHADHSINCLDTPFFNNNRLGPGFEFSLTWSTRDQLAGTPQPLGDGWYHPYMIYLSTTNSGGTTNSYLHIGRGWIHFISDSGSFLTTTSGIYTASASQYRLTQTTNRYVVSLSGGGYYTFDSTGTTNRLEEVVSELGNTLDLTWSDGLLTNVVTADGITNTFTHNGDGHITTVSDGVKSATFAYDGDLLTNITDMAGLSFGITYDGDNWITNLMHHSSGEEYTVSYVNKKYTITTPEGRTMATDSDSDIWPREDHYVTYEDGEGNVSVIKHDPSHPWDVILRRIDAEGRTNFYSHYHTGDVDILGRIKEHRKPDTTRVTYAYDNNGKTTEVRYEDATSNLLRRISTSYTYFSGEAANIPSSITRQEQDAQSNVIAQVTRRYTQYGGADASHEYDDALLMTSVSNYLGGSDYAETLYVYDTNTTVKLQRVDVRAEGTTNTVKSYGYDASGLLVAYTNDVGIGYSYTHDAQGRLETLTDNTGTHTFTYDTLNRVIKKQYPDGTSEAWGYGCCTLDSYTNREGSVTEYLYDSDEKLIQQSVTTPGGREINRTTYTYDGAGHKTNQVDALGNSTSYAYDSNGRLASMTDARGNTTTYEYDSLGRQSKITYPDSTYTTNIYSLQGFVASVDGTHTPSMTYSNDAAGRQIWQTDALGHTVSNFYDDIGRLTKMVYADGSYTRTRHNLRGLPTNRIARVFGTNEEANATTVLAYDSYGRLSTQTDSEGRTTTWSYDATHKSQISAVTNANNEEAEHRYYDSYGRLASNSMYGVITQYSYDALGRVTNTTYADGSTAVNTYDGSLLLSTTDRSGNTTSYGYDDVGRQTSITNARGMVTLYTYDAVGNLQTVTDSLGNTTTYVYDSMNRRTQIVLPDGRITDFEYDDMGRMTAKKGAGAVPVYYTYDDVGRMTQLMDGEYNNTHFYYDEVGNLTNKTYADSSSYAYTYDAQGRLLTRTDAKAVTTTYTYNNVGQLTNIDYDTDTDIVFTYDDLGRLTARTDAAGSWSWAYDGESSRVLTNVTPYDTILYAYTNTTYDVVQVKLDDANETLYTWANGRMTGVESPAGSFSYTYLADSDLLSQIQYPNANATVYRSHDNADRLTCISATNATPSCINYFAYTLDSSGRRTARAHEDGSSIDYAYDWRDQLTNAVMTSSADPAYAAAYNYSYEYDRVGNRLHHDRGLMDLDGTFNNLNQLTSLDIDGKIDVYGTITSTNLPSNVSVVGSAATLWNNTNFWGGAKIGIGTNQGTYTVSVVASNAVGPGYQTNVTFDVDLPPSNPQTFSYDANGSLTNDGIWVYSWNDENRLKEIEAVSPSADKPKLVFTYDGQGRRASRILYDGYSGGAYATTNETHYVYDGWRVLAELTDDNMISNYYGWGLDLSQSLEGAGGIGGLLSLSRNAPVESRVSDVLDDAEEKTSGSVDTNSTDLELVYEGANEQTVGMRFRSISIPQGATITKAYVQFKCDETDSGATTVIINGEDADDASAFSSATSNITSRALTSASVSWTIPVWDTEGEAGADQRTEDISEVIQEIVDREGWSSGNAIALIFSGSGERTAESYDGDPSGAPLLHVEYVTDNYFYFYDGNGNVTEITDDTGANTVAEYEYSPFGTITKSSGSLAELNTFRFSTKQFEPDHKIYDYGRRFYSPGMGRWLSRDPIGVRGGINLYGFVINNPLNVWDILGLDTIEYEYKMDPDAVTSFGYEFVYEYETSCGDDGLSPEFTHIGITSENALWQADQFALGIVGGEFNVNETHTIRNVDCPEGDPGAKLEVDFTFTPVYSVGITIGIGPIGIPIFNPIDMVMDDWPAYETTITIDCCTCP